MILNAYSATVNAPSSRAFAFEWNSRHNTPSSRSMSDAPGVSNNMRDGSRLSSSRTSGGSISEIPFNVDTLHSFLVDLRPSVTYRLLFAQGNPSQITITLR